MSIQESIIESLAVKHIQNVGFTTQSKDFTQEDRLVPNPHLVISREIPAEEWQTITPAQAIALNRVEKHVVKLTADATTGTPGNEKAFYADATEDIENPSTGLLSGFLVVPGSADWIVEIFEDNGSGTAPDYGSPIVLGKGNTWAIDAPTGILWAESGAILSPFTPIWMVGYTFIGKTLDIYENQEQSSDNLLINSSFENWTVSANPDGWTKGSGTILHNTTFVDSYFDTDSLRFAQTPGATYFVRQEITGFNAVNSGWRDRDVTLSIYAKASGGTAQTMALRIEDGVGSSQEVFSITSSYERYKITYRTNVNATLLRVFVAPEGFGPATQTINLWTDGAMLTFGPATIPWTPRNLNDTYDNYMGGSLVVIGTLDVASAITGASLDASGGGITSAGAISGATTINATGLITSDGLNPQNGGITNAGAISGVTSLGASGRITAGSFQAPEYYFEAGTTGGHINWDTTNNVIQAMNGAAGAGGIFTEISIHSNYTTAKSALSTLGSNSLYVLGNIHAGGKLGVGVNPPKMNMQIGLYGGITSGTGFTYLGQNAWYDSETWRRTVATNVVALLGFDGFGGLAYHHNVDANTAINSEITFGQRFNVLRTGQTTIEMPDGGSGSTSALTVRSNANTSSLGASVMIHNQSTSPLAFASLGFRQGAMATPNLGADLFTCWNPGAALEYDLAIRQNTNAGIAFMDGGSNVVATISSAGYIFADGSVNSQINFLGNVSGTSTLGDAGRRFANLFLKGSTGSANIDIDGGLKVETTTYTWITGNGALWYEGGAISSGTGDVWLRAADGIGTFPGQDMRLYAGENDGISPTYANGGAAELRGGDSYDGDGGNVYINGGDHTHGSGSLLHKKGGDVWITSGNIAAGAIIGITNNSYVHLEAGQYGGTVNIQKNYHYQTNIGGNLDIEDGYHIFMGGVGQLYTDYIAYNDSVGANFMRNGSDLTVRLKHGSIAVTDAGGVYSTVMSVSVGDIPLTSPDRWIRCSIGGYTDIRGSLEITITGSAGGTAASTTSVIRFGSFALDYSGAPTAHKSMVNGVVVADDGASMVTASISAVGSTTTPSNIFSVRLYYYIYKGPTHYEDTKATLRFTTNVPVEFYDVIDELP